MILVDFSAQYEYLFKQNILNMPERINKHLKELTQLISELKSESVDIQILFELENSLELLSKKLKITKLELSGQTDKEKKGNLFQDAAIIFNRDFKIIRITGFSANRFGSTDTNTELQKWFEEQEFLKIKEHATQLQKSNGPLIFESAVLSNNKVVLPVIVSLEKINLGDSESFYYAGFTFPRDNPSDITDYQDILIDNLPGLDVFLFDTNFRYILSGGKEKENLKLTNADFKNKTLFEIYDQKTQKRLYPFYKNTLEGNTSEGEVKIKKEIYMVNATPVFDINNRVVGGALILQNITKEKEIEDNLIRAKKEAEEADNAKSLFLAKMSHEIRTPLNAIIGFTGFLSKTNLSAKQEKFSHLIQQSSEHLLSVVNEILFVFKLGMGKVVIEKIPFNLKELIQNVHESLLSQAKNKELTYKFHIGKNIPEILIGDPFRIKQILINLASNAIKFTDVGYVHIRVSQSHIKAKAIHLKFQVVDSGIGLTEEEIKSIFNEFVQVEWKNENSRKGTGLGLTISDKLVHLLNGRITVKSEPQKGSTFTFTIPLEMPHKHEEVSTEKVYNISFNLLEGKRILFADDDENNILLGESILQEWNTDFEIAYNGEEALDILNSSKFDIALIDIHMPKLFGDEVVKRIRKDSENPNRKTKMLAITANIMESDIQKYLNNGFDDYILKPFKEEKLYSKICSLLDIPLEEKPEILVEEMKNNKDVLDTSELLRTARGDIGFFNKMIDTYIENCEKTVQQIPTYTESKNWEQIGEMAHKLISSSRYFGLTKLAVNLGEVEKLALHEKKYDVLPAKVSNLKNEIEKIVLMIKNERLPEA